MTRGCCGSRMRCSPQTTPAPLPYANGDPGMRSSARRMDARVEVHAIEDLVNPHQQQVCSPRTQDRQVVTGRQLHEIAAGACAHVLLLSAYPVEKLEFSRHRVKRFYPTRMLL